MIGLRTLAPCLALLCIAGCGEERIASNPPPPCQNDAPGCAIGRAEAAAAAGSGGGDASGSGAGGAGGGGILSGRVDAMFTSSFDAVQSYDGTANLVALVADGTPPEAAFDGTNPFVFEGLPEGPLWILAEEDPLGGTLVQSTISLQTVPGTDVSVPMVADEVLPAIMASLPVGDVVDETAAHVVVKLERGGLPLPGVELSSSVGNAVVAFDEGIGTYSTTAGITGSAGMLLLLNLAAAGTVNTMTLTVTDDTLNAFQLEVPVVSGAVTIAGYDL